MPLSNILKPLKLIFLAVSIFLLSASAHAIKRQDKAVYGYSTAPYWSVGELSQKLSIACQRRQFSQKRQFR